MEQGFHHKRIHIQIEILCDSNHQSHFRRDQKNNNATVKLQHLLNDLTHQSMIWKCDEQKFFKNYLQRPRAMVGCGGGGGMGPGGGVGVLSGRGLS